MQNPKEDAADSPSPGVKTTACEASFLQDSDQKQIRLLKNLRVKLHAMRSSPIVNRASWTLINQGIVSGGNFVLNIILARNLSAADYGVFVLFLGISYILRAVDYSFISYPLSIRLHTSPIETHPSLLGSTVSLCAALCLGLAAFLGLGVALLGRMDLILPVELCYLAWQSQETMRRCLLANFRYREATLGDAVSYAGQPIVLAIAAHLTSLSVGLVLFLMSITFVSGALVHSSRLHFARPQLSLARDLARVYISLGKWSLVNYQLVIVRLQFFPWALAASLGTAATGSFQAAMNIANLINPITLGMGNALPQAAAHAYHSSGFNGALKTAGHYIAFGLPPVILICFGALLMPELLLRFAYGAHSPYLDYSLAVQLACTAAGIDYVAEMLNKTLLGVKSGKLAVFMNTASVATSFASFPLLVKFGASGACLGLVLANAVRLVTAWIAIKWLIAREKSAPAAAS